MQLIKYFSDVRGELKHIRFLSRKESISIVLMVLVITAISSIVLLLFNAAVGLFLSLLIGLQM